MSHYAKHFATFLRWRTTAALPVEDAMCKFCGKRLVDWNTEGTCCTDDTCCQHWHEREMV